MEQDLKKLEQDFSHLVSRFKDELATIRTNRPTTKLVEDIKVEYLGSWLTVKQLGAISVVPPREINISVWDKNALAAVAKAIEASSLGLSVAVDRNIIRIALPTLTLERRKELERLVRGITEKERIKVRMMRDDIIKKARQQEDEDLEEFMKKKVQAAVDKTNKQLEDLLTAKVKEINE